MLNPHEWAFRCTCIAHYNNGPPRKKRITSGLLVIRSESLLDQRRRRTAMLGAVEGLTTKCAAVTGFLFCALESAVRLLCVHS
jgi:hypothetical protein